MYPVQRQRLPARPSRISASLGLGFRSTRFTAARIMPGVQIPHCALPQAMNASWTACNRSPSATPSLVRIVVPSACSAGMRQLFTSSPFNSIEHAPHSPSPQPSFVPVSFNSSRNTSSSRAIGWASNCTAQPFTVHLMRVSREVSGKRALQSLHQDFGCDRDARNVCAGRILDRVHDGGRGAVERQLAYALCTSGSAVVRHFFEINANRRNIHRSWNNVVRHLAVHHSPFLPDNIFIERIADPLCHTAFDLTRSKHRMDHPADFLNGNEVLDACLVRQRVQRYFGDINPPGIGSVGVSPVFFIVPVNAGWRSVLTGGSEQAELPDVARTSSGELCGGIAFLQKSGVG